VVKFGGSLLDWPEGIDRLRHWLRNTHWQRNTKPRDESPVATLIVVGGGDAVDRLRQVAQAAARGNPAGKCVAQNHHYATAIQDSVAWHESTALNNATVLQEELAHWMSIAAMTVHGRHVARELNLPVVDWAGWQNESFLAHSAEPATGLPNCAVLDAWQFMAYADPLLSPEPLPASWDVTSDSIAARAAVLSGAELVLLKSCLPPESQSATGWSLEAAAAAGYVDQYFPRAAAGLQSAGHRGIVAVDLRH
jgi:aspartokinase-like uncharacterized kinase